MALYFKGLNLECSVFYYAARTFQGANRPGDDCLAPTEVERRSGAVVTDRATAERSKNEYRSSRIQYRYLSCRL